MVVPLFVGRQRSIAALEHVMASDKTLVLAAQRNARTNNPGPDDIFEVGTIGTIIQLLRLPDGTIKVLVEGKSRVRVDCYQSEDPFFEVDVDVIPETQEASVEAVALMRSVHTSFENFVKLNKKIPPEVLMSIASIDDPSRLADSIVAHLNLKLPDKQMLLEVFDPLIRLE